MNKRLIVLSALAFSATLAQAGLNVNFGRSGSPSGQGPTGADTGYQDFFSGHETATTGNLQTYNGITFAEGGLAGTYNVGVALSWPDATSDLTKQAYGRNDSNLNDFYNDNLGMDTRVANGGIGTGTRMTLTLTGLAANQDFTLSSYHVDGDNNSFTFTTDASGATVYTQGKTSTVLPGMTNIGDFDFDYDLTSDGAGTASITYTSTGGTFFAMNGFDVVAVPEPATLGMVALCSGGVLFIRRRFMM